MEIRMMESGFSPGTGLLLPAQTRRKLNRAANEIGIDDFI
jgi:hypothetical protein